MQLNLIRHLPTKWNKEGRLQGRRDIPIDEKLANELVDHIQGNKVQILEAAPFDIVLASSLIRTNQTASYYGYEPKLEALLDELDFGKYEGKLKTSLIEDHGDDWQNNPENLVLGEPLLKFQERIFCFLNKYKYYDNLLIFGHGSWIRALISIQKVGSIKEMNKVVIQNNELVQIEVSDYHFCSS